MLHTAVLLITPVPTVVIVVTDVPLRHTLLVATGKLSRAAVLCYKVTSGQNDRQSSPNAPHYGQHCSPEQPGLGGF